MRPLQTGAPIIEATGRLQTRHAACKITGDGRITNHQYVQENRTILIQKPDTLWNILGCLPICIFCAVVAGCTLKDASWTFTDVTHEAGLGEFRHVNGARGDWWFPETMGSGAAFVDYNEDGAPDIVLVGGGSWTDAPVRALWLFQNDGTGQFADATIPSGLGKIGGYGMGLTAGDIDNDGDDDLYLTTTDRDVLLINNGGIFRDATREAGLGQHNAWHVAALFFDADRDGWLDLYVGGYVTWTPETDMFCSPDGITKSYCTPQLYAGITGRFFVNQGNGTFVERTREAGLWGSGKTLGALSLDVNQDGWPDLALANDTDPDQLYLNQGDGTFLDVGLVRGMALDERGRARAGMGIEAGIVDPSGFTSLFAGNFTDEMTAVYRYTSAGLFEDRAATSGIGPASLPVLTFGITLFDADLDGDLDLFTANGHIDPLIGERSDVTPFRQHPQLFINDGSGNFEDHAPTLGLSEPLVGRGALSADIDGDGDVDLLVTENNGPARLYRNDLSLGSSWLRLHLRGTRSNRNAVGARVIVQTGSLQQERRVRTGMSYGSQSELTLTFGLGGSLFADSVIVLWPSGHIARLARVTAGQTLNLAEPQ